MSEPTLFEKIHQGTIPARFLLREELVFAIEDIDPKAPFHALIIPIKPIPSLSAAEPEDGPTLTAILMAARRLAKEHGLDNGWRLVANTGGYGGQTVPHLHFHILGGRRMGWPPG
jgi:histidine triad (HIT) family protein